MGNQLTGIAPAQIYPVEHYLSDLKDITFVANLGSTRFFKVALAKFREGFVVVKVFANHDPLLSLNPYREELGEIKNQLARAQNCLPFHNSVITDKAGLIVRQYVKYNLYDRISTRPFLNMIEKKWLAFQILCAVNQCHKVNICHGDIKLENIMVTSWNWVFLTDFGSFKPTYLPEDNPADFSYFFDTSRRRICYIAPERFICVPCLETNSNSSSTNLVLPGDEVVKGDLTCAMDVFSVGCSLAELFTEGNPPFDFSQLLSYRTGDYSPWKVLEKIEDSSIKDMVRHMIQKDPSHRLSIEEYLEQQRGKAFPEYFYSFLEVYIHKFTSSASSAMYSSDDKIFKLKTDLPKIIKGVCDIDDTNRDEHVGKKTQGLVIIVSLLTANLRSLKQCNGKLDALEILRILSEYVSSDIILDRLLPYISYFLNDSIPRVRIAAIKTLTHVLSMVKILPRSDANIFPEYVFPNLAHTLEDTAVSVRIEYAQNIAVLAETALKFLELSQAAENYDDSKYDVDDADIASKPLQANYDKELLGLQEIIQQIVSTLLSDHNNMVKQALLQNGITRLCVVFGLQKANDLLLSHMITFLNHKQDRHLREAFFDSIVGVAVYIGWQSAPILKPLLQQGMNDAEEAVVYKAIDTLTNLTEMGLLSKAILYDMINDTSVFLYHPNLWIRQATVGFVCTVARILDVVDIHCKVQPVISRYTKQPVIQLDNELVLLGSLNDPLPRAVFDYLVKSPQIPKLFEHLRDRQLQRGITRTGHLPAYNEVDPVIKPLFRRLQANGMTETVEDKISVMKEYFIKILHQNTMNENISGTNSQFGVVDLSRIPYQIRRHYVKLNYSDAKEGSTGATKKQVKIKASSLDSPSVVMNKEWQHMFGSTENKTQSQKIPAPNTDSHLFQKSSSSSNLNVADSSGKSELTSSVEVNDPSGSHVSPKFKKKNVVYCYAQCKSELRNLVGRKYEQYRHDALGREALDGITHDLNNSSCDWRPKGCLVAHLHEHHGAVNRLRVIPKTALFASCSNDGTVKIWDCGRMENRSIANRSRQTYNRQGGELTSLAVCKSSQWLASSSDQCSIHIFHIEMNSSKMHQVQIRMLDPQEDGHVVDMNHVDAGSQSILAYATLYGSIVGWDLRAPANAWKFESNPSHGLITSMCIDPRHCWVVAGTSNGSIICWDLRFQLPISKLKHPSGSMIHRLLLHPHHESLVISAVQDNNEITMWDMETDARQTTLWASQAPPFSHHEGNDHSARAMYIAASNDKFGSFLLTGGTDMRIRFWDLQNASKCYVIAGSAMDPPISNNGYKSQLIDGTTVIQEAYDWSPPTSGSEEDTPRRGPTAPPIGHYDTISDINMLSTSQNFLLTSSKDGVIKVWK